MTPALSVVLPTHNRAAYLETAIQSVLGQSFEDIELIVVDDGSTDGTAEVLEKQVELDARLRYISTTSPSGPSAARNRGIRAAQGEFLGFLDDDDEWMPGAAQVAVGTLRSRPDLGCVSAWHEVVGPEGSMLTYRGPLHYTADDLLWCNFPAVPFAVLRRESMGDDLAFDEELVTCEDWDHRLRGARRAPMATVPAVLYRYHEGSHDRVSANKARRLAGRARFVVKHTAAMSPSCRSYHEARLRTMATTGLYRRAGLGLSLAWRCPPSVTSVIVREASSARVGRLAKDPGRSARTLLGSVRRLDVVPGS